MYVLGESKLDHKGVNNMDCQYYYEQVNMLTKKLEDTRVINMLTYAAETRDSERLTQIWSLFMKGRGKLWKSMQDFSRRYTRDDFPVIFKDENEYGEGVPFSGQIDVVQLYILFILTGTDYTHLCTTRCYDRMLAELASIDPKLERYLCVHCEYNKTTDYKTMFKIYH